MKKTFEVEYCEPLVGRQSDAKNRVHAGAEVSKALRDGKDVYAVIGTLCEESQAVKSPETKPEMLIDRRINRLENLWKMLCNEESDIISDYGVAYGDRMKWNDDVRDDFDKLITPIQLSKELIWDILYCLKHGSV